MRDESAAEDLKISMENAPEGKKWKYMKANENLVQRFSTTFPNKKVIVKRQENKYSVKMTRRKAVLFCYRQ